ncbi:replicative DNA helicase [Mycobacteroides abscessus]|uniref:replicative DNA helicase n=1 Tax=Mycobacteroides abscessus TaxID=36809 RepID=UPI000D514238|nr:DnaB-like helicase C-terminal domain-containing protein [Mycobacteroides abscessus]PVB19769.1 DNA helicase [Mycobacteroides abscessus]RIU40371.1 DNA helicase [Mycobacteroides abscessus]
MGDGEYGPQPPNSEQAEQSVLGAMLLSKSAIAEVVDKIAGKDFYRPNHQLIFDTIVSMWTAGEPVDPVTVSHALDEIGQLSRVGAPYLLTLYQTCPTAANVGYYSNIIVEKSKLRKVIEAGTRLVQFGYAGEAGTDVDEIVSRAEQEIRGLSEPSTDGVWFKDLVKELDVQAEATIPTPWPELNHLLNGGWMRGGLYAIGGRPGFGKSAVAMNASMFCAERDLRTLLVCMEMPRGQVMRRMAAAGAGVNLSELIRGSWDLEADRRIQNYIDTNLTMPFKLLDKTAMTVENVISHCRKDGPFDVIVVDYLQQLKASDRRDSRERQIAHMSWSLKQLALEMDAVVLAPTQLNRGPMQQNGKMRAPVLTDLRESGGIEQDCDGVILLHYPENEIDFVDFVVAKNRNGSEGSITLRFDKYRQQVRSLSS